MTGIDPAEVARDIAASTILAGARERGAVGTAAEGQVKVLAAKNGDLLRISVDPKLAPGVDLRHLERAIVLAYRRAQRQVYQERLDELATQSGITPHHSMYEAVAERFREPTRTQPGL